MASASATLSRAEYMNRARGLKSDPAAREGLKPLRLVMLASYTTTLLDPTLVVEAARQGLYADIHHGGFGQFEQELLGDAWRARGDEPVALVIAMRLEDMFPDVGLRENVDFAHIEDGVLARIARSA